MAGIPVAILAYLLMAQLTSSLPADVTLMERWQSWLLAAESCSETSPQSLSMRNFSRMVVPVLKKEGCAVSCVGRWQNRLDTLASSLQAGLEPLAATTGRQTNWQVSSPSEAFTIQLVSFVNFMNFIWQPIICYVEDLAGGLKPEWTSVLHCNQTMLLREMEGIVESPGVTMPVDDWIDFIRKTLVRLVDIDVPRSLVKSTFVDIVPFNMPATPATAMHVLRSSLAVELVGPTLARQLGRMLLSDVSELPVPLLSDIDVSLGVKKDLVASLVVAHLPRSGRC
jgi:hypothetical protein